MIYIGNKKKFLNFNTIFTAKPNFYYVFAFTYARKSFIVVTWTFMRKYMFPT